MGSAEYQQARKKALKTYRNLLSNGQYPYLPALEDMVSFSSIVTEEPLGLVEVPLDLVVGTKTAGRRNSFANDFMPLLDEKSEFASKWGFLYDSHIEEGIRDPIIAVEFLNRFYVIEGNKRVSVLKFVGAAAVTAKVTRYIPQRSDALENIIYYEFLDFYKVTQINYISFTQSGSYAKLIAAVGKNPDDLWTDDEKIDFRSAFIHFSDIYKEKGGQKLSNLSVGDALLAYIEIYGYEGMVEKGYPELREEIAAIWKDFQIYPNKRDVELVLGPDEKAEEKTLISRILPKSSSVLKIAFINDRNPETSRWTNGHEMGRAYLQDAYGDQIETTAYFECCEGEDRGENAIKEAVDAGNTVIFTTNSKFLNASVKASLKYPNVIILNCSMNSNLGHVRTYYGRLYEAKFLTGILAGVLSPTPNIGYIADFPIYGAMANINAFSLGVKMVRPDAKVCLEWAGRTDIRALENFGERQVAYVSGLEFLAKTSESRKYGLYDISKDPVENVALPIWNWGKFYERIVGAMLNGNWKKDTPKEAYKAINYYWGISSGLIDVIFSDRIPEATKNLIELIKLDVAHRGYNPFTGLIVSQDGTVQNEDDGFLTLEQITSMDYLLDNVEGSLPAYDELNVYAKEIVSLMGVAKYNEYKGKS